MPKFSDKSLSKLETTHVDLQTLFKTVIRYFDCTVVSGNRTAEEQQALYAKGRTEPGDIVTHKDGVNSKSRHQSGNAVDVVPYPEMWSDENKSIEFGGFVMGIHTMLKEQGKIKSEIEWGYQLWGWDMPHFQIKN